MECCVSAEGKRGTELFPFTAQGWPATAAQRDSFIPSTKPVPVFSGTASTKALCIQQFSMFMKRPDAQDSIGDEELAWGREAPTMFAE